jgi:putative FmdB family regulatory protein
MPIYAYKCESCGHTKDVLQKMSDAPLTDCPQCGAPAFKKQLTAAGFQLKGSGWYVTDFRGGNSAGAPSAGSEANGGKSGEPAAPGATAAAPAAAVASQPATGSASVAPAPSASTAAPARSKSSTSSKAKGDA